MGGAFNMVTPPFVSVVVPTYNRRDSLKSTIESLLAQDYPSFEVLALDDQSSDATGSILAQISRTQPKLKVLTGSPLSRRILRNFPFVGA